MNSEQPKTQASAADDNYSAHSATKEQLNEESHLGFLSKLVYRRVPQAIGFYLAGSWTFLEFFESLISRYNFSPHWQDVSLLIIVLLFPSILILAYRHGAPGTQDWTNVEKVGIPSNVLITFLIIFGQFSTKDLGSSSEMVKGLGPDGAMLELKRPKAEFRKRLSIVFFDIDDQTTDEYLALGIPMAIKHDLEQDPYLNVFDPGDLAYEIKQSNYRDLKVPMALMLKIAKNNRIEYLATGKFLIKDQRVILTTNLYKVADGLLIKRLKTTDHEDVFHAIDDMSVQIKSAIGFSGGHINHTSDLPITEQLTSSVPAFIAYVKSRHQQRFKDDFTSSENELKKAIKLDDSFAVAASEYALLLLRQTRTEQGLSMLKIAQKHNYRLTDSSKFALAAIESLFRADPDSARDVVNRWLELYPDDADAWSMKFSLHRNFDERLLAIEAMRKIIEIEPFGTHRHLTIGEIYTSLGDIEAALDEYKIFTAKNPTNARGHLLIGDSNRSLGQFELARIEYQQARILLINDLTADRNLANLLLREGKFQQAEAQIKAHLKASRIPEDEYRTWREIASLYWLRGQWNESLSAYRNSFEALKTFTPETSYLLMRVQESWRFAATENATEGQQMIDDARLLIEAGKNNIYELNIKIAQAMFDAQIAKTANSMKLIDDVAESISSYVGSGIDDDISMFKGIVQFKAQEYAESVESMLLFLEKNPIDQLDMMSILGESQIRSGQFSAARDTFEKIIEQFPAHPYANFGMARVEWTQENPVEASRYLEKALLGWAPADTTFEPAIEARKLSEKLKSI